MSVGNPLMTPITYFPLEGEIVSVFETDNPKPQVVTYNVRIRLHNGNETILSNVPISTSFGGVTEYIQYKRRTTKSSQVQALDPNTTAARSSNVGDRVIVCFLGGDLRRAVIFAGLPHPQMKLDLPDPTAITDDDNPQVKFTFNGLSIEIDDQGLFTITKLGAPTVISTGSTVSITPADPSEKSIFKMDEGGKVSFESEQGGLSLSFGDDVTATSSSGNVALESTSADLTLNGSDAKVKLSQGKVAIGSDSAELLDLFNQTLQLFITSAPNLTVSAGGPGALSPNVITQLQQIQENLKSH